MTAIRRAFATLGELVLIVAGSKLVRLLALTDGREPIRRWPDSSEEEG